jgi:hypothetical protein
MAFVQQQPRLFSRHDIETLNVGQIGVYGIYRAGLWIYIGKGDIRRRMLDHVGGDNPLILSHGPTHWVAELTVGDPTNREKQLIMECSPYCNQRVG